MILRKRNGAPVEPRSAAKSTGCHQNRPSSNKTAAGGLQPFSWVEGRHA